MKNPSWYEDPPEDDEPEEDAADPDTLDYGDYLYDQQKDARAEKEAKERAANLHWDDPDHAPYNNRK